MTNPRATSESVLALFATEGHRFEARNLATAAHRAAKFRGHDLRQDRRMATLADACRARVRDFEPQHLANTAWAFATMGIDARKLFDAIADAARSRLSEFKAQELANTAWAFAKSGIDARELFDAIADAARSRLCEFNAQNLANTAWAFATMGIDARKLFDAIADRKSVV